ncbi:ABC transporter [Pseudoduganella sp. FT93W]|uniref:ABC transporter n=1 Tax=Duganella fentianensis TaxID=2692177 RepID=A0A845HYP4_9BURK|nr:ABC-type transport auxiliary lipoprotein family protein [Duganella fentianensis]MYN46012.1 ABC transporter [Duganella fentianensis]
MTVQLRHLFALATCALLLGGCASNPPATARYDFGPLPAPSTSSQIGTLIVADITGPTALDTEHMQYRLLYADARQARPYAYNQWAATPFQLLGQRLRANFAQAGVKVLSTTDAITSPTVLRMEVNEFTQSFDTAKSSQGILNVRASLFRNHRLLDQRTFQRSVAAPTPDAAGGAQALAEASDALAADLLAWLASVPQP